MLKESGPITSIYAKPLGRFYYTIIAYVTTHFLNANIESATGRERLSGYASEISKRREAKGI